MKVLIADLFSAVAIMEMQGAGMEVHFNKDLNGETLTKALEELSPEILVVRSTKVQVDQIDANPKLQLVVRAGAGTDTIDVAHCSRKGIYVANCPGKNAHAVSELTIGLLLSIDRRMAEGNQMLNEGKWNKAMFSKCKGLKGRTIGLVGYGAIAKLVCKTARALEMNVVVSTRTQHEGLDLQDNFKYVSRNELLEQSDIVSIHCPNTAETKGMVNKEFLELMKPDAVLLNTSRGSVINDDDLLAKLEACPDFWYGTDVFNGEPSTGKAEWSCPISAHPRVYGTHHCGASTAQAESAIGVEALRVIKKFVSSGEVDEANTVNRQKSCNDLAKVVVRYRTKINVLKSVFEMLSMMQMNVMDVQNMVFKEREAAVVVLRFAADKEAAQEVALELRKIEHVLDVQV